MKNKISSIAAKKRLAKKPKDWMSQIAKKRHASSTPEQRKLLAIKLNEARWGKKKDNEK